MATTVPEPPVHDLPSDNNRFPGNGKIGHGGGRILRPAEGHLRAVDDYSPSPSGTGIWVGLTAITMSFAAFTSAMIVRKGGASDWRHFTIPSILYLNTVVLLVSSVTLEVARRRIAAFMNGNTPRPAVASKWLYATLFLGLCFLGGQYAGWLQLKSQGLFLATSPSSSFFYVFTAVHGLHIVGGLAGLIYVIRKLHRLVLRRSTLDAASRYWHFMDAVWVYLLFMLWAKF
ncbi:MAG: cytochrome c oxidase subunit 3 [Acidobacteriales bacterium]|nr:cytochrome c oxidase subunit 3 [Terriglobales bacterium]